MTIRAISQRAIVTHSDHKALVTRLRVGVAEIIVASANMGSRATSNEQVREDLAELVGEVGASVLLVQEAGKRPLKDICPTGYTFTQAGRDAIIWRLGFPGVKTGAFLLSKRTRVGAGKGGVGVAPLKFLLTQHAPTLTLEVGGEPVTFVSVHLVASQQHPLRARLAHRQATNVAAWAADHAAANVVVGGDHNTHASAPQLAPLKLAGFDTLSIKHPINTGPHNDPIDFVWTREARMIVQPGPEPRPEPAPAPTIDPPPPGTDPYDRTTYDGKTVDWLTRLALEVAASELGYDLTLLQGSYHGGVSASAGTHDGGGVVDLAPFDWENKVRVLRSIGFAAWHRTPIPGLWGEHIHAVLIGNEKLSPAAAQQVTEYLDGQDGLADHGPDNGPRDYLNARFTWEDNMPLSEDDIAKIAAAVWDYGLTPLNGGRKTNVKQLLRQIHAKVAGTAKTTTARKQA